MALRVSEECVHEEESTVQTRHSKGPAEVSFQPKLSVFSISGTESVFDTAGQFSIESLKPFHSMPHMLYRSHIFVRKLAPITGYAR